ncbi:MAG: ribbon-helix-helix protein, CopG family [Candidatus Lokiarchaeota archaeon]|nr:ribbon-helix-helix protein, CopG family [Candidatus Lokiarchaeota archaeon]
MYNGDLVLKIVTVNVPESYIDVIEKLVGENGLYPSRSELIRCAVREFLIKELRMAKSFQKHKSEPDLEYLDEEKYVRVPVDNFDDDEPVREFKTYKIIKKLEY